MTGPSTEEPDESAIARLRRRKVVQWGLAYVAGAWALLQGLEYLTSTFDWPREFQRVATLVLLFGLLIVLTLAWYHGDKGRQRASRFELAILALIIVGGGVVAWHYGRIAPTDDARTVHVPASHAPALGAVDRSIAVLPFRNISADEDQEYFADGISEEVLNLLTQVPELRVIARSSSFSFKGKDADIATIARALNVAHVLEGSVRSSGDKLRISAQLIRTSDSSNLWSRTYDRQLTDVFEIQDEIAAAVVDELKVKLLGSVPRSTTTNPEAYRLFLKARDVHRLATAAAYTQAVDLYRQSLAIDPGYADAWVGLSTAYCDQVDLYLMPPDEGIRRARDAIAKALALAPRNAAAHARMGWIAGYYDRDLAEGARQMEYALELEPANADALTLAAGIARRLGRLDMAIAIGEYLVDRNPLTAFSRFELATCYYYAGRLDDAIAMYRADLERFPGSVSEHELIGEVLLRKGDAAAALKEFEQEPDQALRLVGLSVGHHALGSRDRSDAALEELVKSHARTMSWSIAMVYAFRGEADRAFEWLAIAVQYRDPTVGSTAGYPLLSNLHDDPRWLPFLRANGMAPEQLAAIEFDVKMPN